MLTHTRSSRTTASCAADSVLPFRFRQRLQISPDSIGAVKITGSPDQNAERAYRDTITNGIHIHAALDFMRKTDAATFIRVVRRLWQFADGEERRSLVYGIVLFRNEPHVKSLLSEQNLPPELIDALVHEVSTRGFSDDYENEALEDILGFLSQDALYELAIREHKAGQNTTVLYILLKMDVRHLDRYFEDPARVRIFITGVC